MDPLSITTAALSISKLASSIGGTLYKFIRSTQGINQTVADLATEVQSLADTCAQLHAQLPDVIQQYVSTDAEGPRDLWTSAKTKLDDCDKTLRQLDQAFDGVREDRSNPFSQAWRQIKLNMSQDDIVATRNRLRTHTTALQITLQVITITIAHLAPKQAGQTLLTKLDSLQRTVDQLVAQSRAMQGDDRDVDDHVLLQRAAETLSSGASLYAVSVASGSTFHGSEQLARTSTSRSRVPGSRTSISSHTAYTPSNSSGATVRNMDDPIPAWLRRMQQMNLDDSTPSHTAYTPSSTSAADANIRGSDTPGTSTFNEDDINDWDDAFEISIVKQAMQLADEAMTAEDYVSAEEHLKAGSQILAQLPVDHRAACRPRNIEFLLAICTFHNGELSDAESALTAFLEHPVASDRSDAVKLCKAGHLLAQTYVRLGKLELARSTCHGVLRARWKLVGDKDSTYHESLALYSRIHTRRDRPHDAKLYASMIPKEQASSIFEELDATLKRSTASGTGVSTESHVSAQHDHLAWLDEMQLEPCNELQRAIVARQTDVARRLARDGTQVNAASQKGLTALHLAVLAGNVQLAELLIPQSNVHAECSSILGRNFGYCILPFNYQPTALHFAIAACHEGMIRMLVRHGADVLVCPSQQLWFGPTAFFGFQFEIDPDSFARTIETLKSLQWDTNVLVTSKRQTLLHLAAIRFSHRPDRQPTMVAVARKLLDKGADVLLNDSYSRIALQYAVAENDCPDMIKLLLDHKQAEQATYLHNVLYRGA